MTGAMPVVGSEAKSCAMIPAVPRRNAYGGDHSPDPDRDQPVQAVVVGGDDLLYRVGPVVGREHRMLRRPARRPLHVAVLHSLEPGTRRPPSPTTAGASASAGLRPRTTAPSPGRLPEPA